VEEVVEVGSGVNRVKAGKTVLVTGYSPIGLFAISVAKLLKQAGYTQAM